MRLRRDIDDLDDTMFDRDVAADRRRQREEERALAVERTKQSEVQEAVIAARGREFMAETSQRLILAEYHAAGIAPRPGTLVSIRTLMTLGWTIEDVGQDRILVAPPKQPKYEPRGGECT